MAKNKTEKQLKQISSDGNGVELRHTQEGILPPAEELAILEKLNPGTIDRFLKLAEKDQDYFIQNDFKYFSKIVFNTRFGMIFGFSAFMTINVLAGYMIYSGADTQAVATIIAELVAGLMAYYKGVGK